MGWEVYSTIKFMKIRVEKIDKTVCSKTVSWINGGVIIHHYMVEEM